MSDIMPDSELPTQLHDCVYWTVTWWGSKIDTTMDIWYGTFTDFARLRMGNCFNTEKEAEANKYAVYKRVTGRDWSKHWGTSLKESIKNLFTKPKTDWEGICKNENG